MPRPSRVTPDGVLFHVLNRGRGWLHWFHKDADDLASVKRGRPCGEAAWIGRGARKPGLEFTLRRSGHLRLGE